MGVGRGSVLLTGQVGLCLTPHLSDVTQFLDPQSIRPVCFSRCDHFLGQGRREVTSCCEISRWHHVTQLDHFYFKLREIFLATKPSVRRADRALTPSSVCPNSCSDITFIMENGPVTKSHSFLAHFLRFHSPQGLARQNRVLDRGGTGVGPQHFYSEDKKMHFYTGENV